MAVREGSAFRRMDPVRWMGSWGMVIRRWRIVSRGMVDRSTSSMKRVPESISRMRRMVARREDLPLCGGSGFGEHERMRRIRCYGLTCQFDRRFLSSDQVIFST